MGSPRAGELLDRLRANVAANPVRFEVEFDRDLGYPISASVDVRAEIADDEYQFEISQVGALIPLD